MDIAEVVLRLTGPVEPVGDSAMDDHRLESLRALCDVAGVLLDRIELVAEAYGDHMASIKVAKDHAAAFLRSRGEEAVARERERCARIAEDAEAGDGSHDYNAGAETMQERIVKAIRNAGVALPQGPRVLNALEVLERAALGPESQGTAAQFLKCLGECGMWVIENPLAAHGVKPCPYCDAPPGHWHSFSCPVRAQPASASVAPSQAHSKSEYKRRVAMGDPNVAPPLGVPPCGEAQQKGGE